MTIIRCWRQRGSLTAWFDPAMKWEATLPGRWPPTDRQRCSHPHVPDGHSPLWQGALINDGVLHEPAEAGRSRLVRARFQHVGPAPEDPPAVNTPCRWSQAHGGKPISASMRKSGRSNSLARLSAMLPSSGKQSTRLIANSRHCPIFRARSRRTRIATVTADRAHDTRRCQ